MGMFMQFLIWQSVYPWVLVSDFFTLIIFIKERQSTVCYINSVDSPVMYRAARGIVAVVSVSDRFFIGGVARATLNQVWILSEWFSTKLRRGGPVLPWKEIDSYVSTGICAKMNAKALVEYNAPILFSVFSFVSFSKKIRLLTESSQCIVVSKRDRPNCELHNGDVDFKQIQKII